MDRLLDAITSGVVPLLLTVLTPIITAAAAYAVAWLKAQTALQEQAIRNAVDHVDALQEAPVDLSRTMAKRMAMKRVQAELKRPPPPEKLAAKIDAVVEAKRSGASEPPKA